MRLTSICCMSRNRVIGNKEGLPWHLPQDLRRFSRTTREHVVIMGYKTFKDIDGVLPNRKSIVITSKKRIHKSNDVYFVNSLDEALDLAEVLSVRAGKEEAFVIGGESIYRQTMGLVDKILLTIIDKDFDGYAKFPELSEEEWLCETTEESTHGELSFSFNTFTRAIEL